MDMNRLTQKSQEALHDAQTKALRFGPRRGATASTCCWPCSTSPRAWSRRCSPGRGADPDRLREDLEAELGRRPRVSGLAPTPGQVLRHRSGSHGCSTRPSGRPDRLKDEYVSVEHLWSSPWWRRARARRPGGSSTRRG